MSKIGIKKTLEVIEVSEKKIFYPLQAKPKEDISNKFYPLGAKNEDKTPPIIKFSNQQVYS